jgi:hypothetical protein
VLPEVGPRMQHAFIRCFADPGVLYVCEINHEYRVS